MLLMDSSVDWTGHSRGKNQRAGRCVNRIRTAKKKETVRKLQKGVNT